MKLISSVISLSLLFWAVTSALGSLEPQPIPRAALHHFTSEGVFEGGSNTPANLESLRFSFHNHEGYERWVFDFSDAASRVLNKTAPRFQLRYVKASHVEMQGGGEMPIAPPRFILTFQNLQKNFLKNENLEKLAAKSHFLKSIVLYPPIENGDTAVELVLKDNVVFEPHQPKEKEGRLVLDLKNAPLGQ